MKQKIKKIIFGEGQRDFLFKHGILKNLKFRIDPMNKFQRIIGLDEKEIEKVTNVYKIKIIFNSYPVKTT